MSKTYSIAEIAKIVNGKILGDPNLAIQGLCALNEIKPGCITFSTAKTPKALMRSLADGRPSAIFIREDVTPPDGITCIAVKDPQRAMIAVIPLFKENVKPSPGISDKADIAPTAKIGKDVFIGAFTVIGEDCIIEDGAIIHPHVILYRAAHIGKNAVIHAGAIIREFCVIGDNVIIQNGAVIGADGFGYIPNADGSLLAVPQVGITQLDDNVEIGANTCVDRAALGTTHIGQGTKIDNQVQIGHNTKVGKHSIICGQGGVAGSAEIGDHVILGARIGIADHVKITSMCRFGANTCVPQDISAPGDYAGVPAVPAMEYRRGLNIMKNLPSFYAAIRKQQRNENENK